MKAHKTKFYNLFRTENFCLKGFGYTNMYILDIQILLIDRPINEPFQWIQVCLLIITDNFFYSIG